VDPSKLFQNALSRRNFLAGAGAVTAGALITGCSSTGSVSVPAVTSYSDTDILNFALNLEYVEAEFYLRAATGSGLSTADAGSNPGSVNGGSKIPGLTTFQQNFLNEIAYTEQEHVRFLRTTLGSAAVSRPAIDLTAGFNGIATAANALSAASTSLPAIPAGYSPFASYDAFVVGALAFEDTGVTAYSGAAPLISPAGIAAGYLGASAGILAVEAYHAGTLRAYLTGQSILQGYTAYPYALLANRVGNLFSALSGATTTTPLGGFQATPTPIIALEITSVVPANSNAIAYARTTDQVLHIVYGSFSNTSGATTPAAGVAKGGFFPNGLNGNISVTQS
jgi:hypothetical protein